MKSEAMRQSARPLPASDASEAAGSQNAVSPSQQPAAGAAPASISGPLQHLQSGRPKRGQAGESSSSGRDQGAALAPAFVAAVEIAQETNVARPAASPGGLHVLADAALVEVAQETNVARPAASSGGLHVLADTALTVDAAIEQTPAQSSGAHAPIPHGLTTASVAESAGISAPAISQSEIDRILNDALSGAFERAAMTTAEVIKIAQMPNSDLRAILINTINEAIDEAINKPVAMTAAQVVNQARHQPSRPSAEVISLAKAVEKAQMPRPNVNSILTNALSRSFKRTVMSLDDVAKLATTRADSHRMTLAEVINVADVLKKTLQKQKTPQKRKAVPKPDAHASTLNSQTVQRLLPELRDRHGLTTDDVVSIAGNIGGDQALEALEAVKRLLPRLCNDHGLTPRQVVSIASHNGGSQALEAVQRLLPRLRMDHGLTTRQVVAIASNHGGKQALEAVHRLLPLLCRDHDLNPDHVASIASQEGGKQALEMVQKLLLLGVSRSVVLASTASNKRKRETQNAQADAARVKRQRAQTGAPRPTGESLPRPSDNAHLQKVAVNWLAQRFPHAFGTVEDQSNANAAQMPVRDEQLGSILAQSPTRGYDPASNAFGGLTMEELAGSAQPH